MPENLQRRYLLFEINQSLLALDLSAVAEVTDLLPIWPVPFAPSSCSGSIHIHGSIFAVFDLAPVLGHKIATSPEKMIILNKDVASLAIMATKVFKIINEKDLDSVETADSDFFTETLVLESGRFSLLDVYNIVQLLEDTMKLKRFFS